MSGGKTVIVTGAASGLGAATAARLAAAGERVIGLDLRPCGPGVTSVVCDLADPAAIDAAVARLPAQIDALIHCAAHPGPTPPELTLKVNLLGLRHLTETVQLRLADGGSVTSIASIAGYEWRRRAELVFEMLGTKNFADGLDWGMSNATRWAKDPYTFTKQCVIAYSMQKAGSGLGRRLRFNSVSPGGIDTPMTPAFRAQLGDAQADWSNAQTGRAATPDEIAEVVTFVATGQCTWLNGADIVVDNGFTAGLLTGWINIADSPAAKARAARQ